MYDAWAAASNFMVVRSALAGAEGGGSDGGDGDDGGSAHNSERTPCSAHVWLQTSARIPVLGTPAGRVHERPYLLRA